MSWAFIKIVKSKYSNDAYCAIVINHLINDNFDAMEAKSSETRLSPAWNENILDSCKYFFSNDEIIGKLILFHQMLKCRLQKDKHNGDSQCNNDQSSPQSIVAVNFVIVQCAKRVVFIANLKRKHIITKRIRRHSFRCCYVGSFGNDSSLLIIILLDNRYCFYNQILLYHLHCRSP